MLVQVTGIKLLLLNNTAHYGHNRTFTARHSCNTYTQVSDAIYNSTCSRRCACNTCGLSKPTHKTCCWQTPCLCSCRTRTHTPAARCSCFSQHAVPQWLTKLNTLQGISTSCTSLGLILDSQISCSHTFMCIAWCGLDIQISYLTNFLIVMPWLCRHSALQKS